MVAAGMSAKEAIIAATLSAADNMGKLDQFGSLEPGKSGDLIAVDGNPLTDVTELEDVDFVMKSGIAYKQ